MSTYSNPTNTLLTL